MASTPALCESVPPEPPLTVLTIYWGAEDFPGTADMDAAIRDAVTSGQQTPVDYFAEYLESDFFPEDDASVALADYIRSKYRGRRIDVVIAFTGPALQFVLKWRERLFAGVP